MCRCRREIKTRGPKGKRVMHIAGQTQRDVAVEKVVRLANDSHDHGLAAERARRAVQGSGGVAKEVGGEAGERRGPGGHVREE